MSVITSGISVTPSQGPGAFGVAGDFATLLAGFATIIASDPVSNQMIAFDATQLALGSNAIELSASDQAMVQADTAPDSPPTASTPYISLWQNNLVGLLAHRYFGCERLRTGAVSVVGPLNYTSANSPA